MYTKSFTTSSFLRLLLPGWSWLATIAKLMGLIPLPSSFPSAGSCLRPFLLSQTTPPPPQDTLTPRFDSFHALHKSQISLFHSSAISVCVHYLDLLDVRCPICSTYVVSFLVQSSLFASPSPPFSDWLLPSFFHVLPVPPSDLSLLFHLLSLTINPLFLFTFSFQIPWYALLVQRMIHCQHISHGWGVAPHSNII